MKLIHKSNVIAAFVVIFVAFVWLMSFEPVHREVGLSSTVVADCNASNRHASPVKALAPTTRERSSHEPLVVSAGQPASQRIADDTSVGLSTSELRIIVSDLQGARVANAPVNIKLKSNADAASQWRRVFANSHGVAIVSPIDVGNWIIQSEPFANYYQSDASVATIGGSEIQELHITLEEDDPSSWVSFTGEYLEPRDITSLRVEFVTESGKIIWSKPDWLRGNIFFEDVTSLNANQLRYSFDEGVTVKTLSFIPGQREVALR